MSAPCNTSKHFSRQFRQARNICGPWRCAASRGCGVSLWNEPWARLAVLPSLPQGKDGGPEICVARRALLPHAVAGA
eukprot:9486078-Pyramimonas_sp.AAC.1